MSKYDKQAHLTQIHNNLVEMYIPKRYRSATLDQVDDPKIRAWAADPSPDAEVRAAEVAASESAQPSWRPEGVLYLCGEFGTGKTFAAWAVVNDYLWHPITNTTSISCFYGGLTATLLESMMPGCVRDDDRGTIRDPIIRAMKTPLLLLDDLGGHKPSEWREETIFKIIDYRYNEEKPTIVTSNLAPNEIGDVVGGKVASRLAEDATIVALNGEDRRRSAA